MKRPRTRMVFLTLGLWCSSILAGAQDVPSPAPGAPKAAAIRDPFEEIYKGYTVDLTDGLNAMQQSGRTPEEMKLSSEKTFFTLTLLDESSRADALVEAGKQKEEAGLFREALEVYQKIIDEYSDKLYRVNEWGIFVPVSEYCQLRILSFPKEHLELYRTKHDSRAKESFEIARQRNSLEGVAQIRDKMLATSFGGPALMTLGYSALDQGHFLEALEYFEMVWNSFPDLRTQSPDLALSIALCRKTLGIGEKSGAGYGLIGHWKFDDGGGTTAADSSGYGNHGTGWRAEDGSTPAATNWVPGKIGGALRFGAPVGVPGRASMDIGEGGADFSVAFWVCLEQGRESHALFAKSGPSANDMLALGVRGAKSQITYTIATQSPKWETGNSKGGVGMKRWTHVAFVKVGQDVKLYLDGKLDLREALKGQALRNTGGVTIGPPHLQGLLDDVRLYHRALLDREVAELAGATGTATMTAGPASGEAPLAVEFACPATAAGAEYLWEFGDGQTATGPKVRHVYGLGGDWTATLTVTDANGAIAVARTKIAVRWRVKDEDFARRMGQVLGDAKHERQLLAVQRTSAPNPSADDYAPLPPTTDPMGLTPPVWKTAMPGSRRDKYVYTQPVVTRNSILYRHKNIVYCHAILNGELRWKNDLGGRVVWQDGNEFQWPQEDILVQDGMVFTPMFKVGQTLVALDEITGRLKWAYGPMTAGTPEEANMRFGAAPAGGPRTVYAGYVLDNIEGETHTDSEYGVIAFESVTGRLKWRRPICTLRPGQFTAGFAERRRNKIRSFFSPPLYHEGTVYTTTDAGAVAALDALSGRIKWVLRYPYYRRGHDSTLSIHGSWYNPTLWYNQRPLLIGEQLYVMPVDSSLFLCLDRRSGKILWNRTKMSGAVNYFVGAMSTGELVFALTGRTRWPAEQSPVVLLDPKTGKETWKSPDLVAWEDKPVLKHYMYATLACCNINQRHFENAARPFLGSDDMLFVSQYSFIGPYETGEYVYHLAGIDLQNRKIVHQRRYLSDIALALTDRIIRESVPRIKQIDDVPFKPDQLSRSGRCWRKSAGIPSRSTPTGHSCRSSG